MDIVMEPHVEHMRKLWGEKGVGDSNYAACAVDMGNGVTRYYYLAGLSLLQDGHLKDQLCYRDSNALGTEVAVLNAATPGLLEAVQADGGNFVLHIGDPTVMKMINGTDGSTLYHMYFTLAAGYAQTDTQLWGCVSGDGVNFCCFKRIITKDMDVPGQGMVSGWGDGAGCPSAIEYPGLPDGAMFAMVFENRNMNTGLWLVTLNGLMDVVHGPIQIYDRVSQSPGNCGVVCNPVIRKFGNEYRLFFNEFLGCIQPPDPLPPELVGNPMAEGVSAENIIIGMAKSLDILNFNNGSRIPLLSCEDNPGMGALSVPGVEKIDETHYKMTFTPIYGVYPNGWFDLCISEELMEWDYVIT